MRTSGNPKRIFSDHVGVLIELNGRKLFQSSTANMGTARVKALNLRDQKQCDRFLQVVDAHMQHQNVDERSAKLQTEMPYGIFATPAQERKYERIAADVDDAMNAGITAVCHTNVGYHRSPALTSAANLVRYWKHQRQARRHDVGLSTRLIQYAQLNGLPQSVLRELDILQHLRESWAALRTVQTQAREERSEWLNELADSLATAKRTTREKAIAQMAQESVSKETFRKLRFISKGAQSGGLSAVKRPNHNW